jgi:uncharacterized protein YciI
MFVVLLHYRAPTAAIDKHMREHVAFLEECYRAGLFLASGRRNPRVGGVILATAPSEAELREILAHDPFVRDGLAEVELIEFRTSLHHPALGRFADAGTRKVRGAPDV